MSLEPDLQKDPGPEGAQPISKREFFPWEGKTLEEPMRLREDENHLPEGKNPIVEIIVLPNGVRYARVCDNTGREIDHNWNTRSRGKYEYAGDLGGGLFLEWVGVERGENGQNHCRSEVEKRFDPNARDEETGLPATHGLWYDIDPHSKDFSAIYNCQSGGEDIHIRIYTKPRARESNQQASPEALSCSIFIKNADEEIEFYFDPNGLLEKIEVKTTDSHDETTTVIIEKEKLRSLLAKKIVRGVFGVENDGPLILDVGKTLKNLIENDAKRPKNPIRLMAFIGATDIK
ncbi:hypothetical protein KBI33_02180 [Candidatus Shapirobacteria bacterium]|nr:hypothetical protein [Candidatus Shapirobacteria bacterium]